MGSKKEPDTSDDLKIQATIKISPPNLVVAEFVLKGTTPLRINRFTEKAKLMMKEKQEAGKPGASRTNRSAKEFEQLSRDAEHRSHEGWPGIHAACLRLGMISTCRLVGYKMTLAKLAIRTLEDGFDRRDGTPLLRIWGPEPMMSIEPVRQGRTVDLRARPQWNEWELRPRIEYDADQFTLSDITNLLMRVGCQAGIGEGRADSRMSAGIGFGYFKIARTSEKEKAA